MPRYFDRFLPTPLREWPLQIWLHLLLVLMMVFSSALGVKLIVDYYQQYSISQQHHHQIQNLRIVARAANFVSGERGPTNLVLAGKNDATVTVLQNFREKTDSALEAAANVERVAPEIRIMQRTLASLRKRIDTLASSAAPDPMAWKSILADMFSLSDNMHALTSIAIDANTISASRIPSTLIMLSELRDQAGRLGSYIVMSMMEEGPMHHSLQTDFERTYGKVERIGKEVLMMTADSRDPTVMHAREAVSRDFFVHGMALLSSKADERVSGNLSNMTSGDFTKRIVPTFAPLTELRDAYTDAMLKELQREVENRRRALVILTALTLFVLSIEFWILAAAEVYLFRPLLQAKRHLIELAHGDTKRQIDHRYTRGEMFDLYQALHALRLKLVERNHLDSERVSLTKQLRVLANTDSLTGALNRRGMDELVRTRIAASTPSQQLSLILIDIDHFKQINDTYGHDCGDHTLQEMARRLQAGLRENDALARFGGDEFAIFLSDSKQQAMDIARRLKQALEAMPFVLNEKTSIPITGSFGVASMNEEIRDWLQLLKAADIALYSAKHAGRNRIESNQVENISTH